MVPQNSQPVLDAFCTGTPLVMAPVEAFFVCVLSYEPCSTGLLWGEHSRFDEFQEQKTEAPVELLFTIFTYSSCAFCVLHVAPYYSNQTLISLLSS